jgi:hypothetical protein
MEKQSKGRTEQRNKLTNKKINVVKVSVLN